jgi:glycosyltransferase involved in cell wall biosynthesis
MSRFVSVVIPVYNDTLGIHKALKALVNQTYPRDAYEIIVADNGSRDGTRTVVEQFQAQYPDLVHLVVENEVQGSYAARNKGVRAAQGEILAFTDADCIPIPEWLEEGVKAIVEENAAFAAGQIKMTFQGKESNIWEYLDAARKLNQRAYVEDAGFGATANLFVRRDLFDKYGLFRDDLQSGGDYEFGRRLTKSGEKLVYAERAIVHHPARRTFKSILKKSRRVARGEKQLQEMGLLGPGSVLSWRSLIPVRRCPPLSGVSLALPQRFAVVLMANLFRYYNVVQRL